MTWLRVLGSRLLELVLRRQREERLDDEIQAHLDLLVDEYVGRGLTVEEARRAARRTFGGVDHLKEVHRDQRGLPALDAIGQDVAFALRLLRRDRGFTLTALFVLSLGIGVNNTLFTILNAHTLRGLPIPSAERVASIGTIDDRNQNRGVSYPEYLELRQGARSFTAMIATTTAPVIVSGDGRAAERLDAAYLSGDPFAIAEGQPAHGRGFATGDDRAGAAPIVMISEDLWTTRYDKDPAVLGRSLLVNGAAATIVGVMPDRSGLPITPAVWLPLAHLPGLLDRKRSDRDIRVSARLDDGVEFDAARTEVQAIGERLAGDHPDTNRQVRMLAVPINEQYFGRWDDPVWFQFMTVGFLVLLISSANVANLLLARAITRTRELAIRASLGASRRRIVRQLLIEGAVLAAIGGLAGLALATLGVRLLRAGIPENALPYWIDYSPDARVFVALVLVSFGAIFVFALVPAIQASKADINRVVKDGGRAGLDGRAARRWTTAFLVAEFAFAIVLLAHVVMSFRDSTPPLPSEAVIDTPHVLTASVTLSGSRYQTPDERTRFYRLLRERLQGVADVTSMSVATAAPFAGGGEARIAVAGRPMPDAADRPVVKTVAIGPAYFETLALDLLRGRDFVDGDGAGSAGVAIVNQEFARHFLADVDPIGQQLALAAGAAPSTAESVTIVGVAPDMRQGRGSGAEPVVFTPYFRAPEATATLLVRSRNNGALVAAKVRDEVAALDASLPLYRVQTMENAIWMARWNGRLSQRMIMTLTFIAAGLSTIGLYAVTMHGIRQRTQEIGVRMALGAKPRHVMTLVLRRALVQLGLGFFAGIACTKWWVRGGSGDSDISASDPETLLMVGGILLVLAAVACAVPTARATRLDPVAAIRHE